MHSALREQDGQELVEFALVLPILLLVLLGVIEFGRAIFYQNTITNAAREGARCAVVGGVARADPCARQYTAGLDATQLQVHTNRDSSTIQVIVEYQMAFVVPRLLGLSPVLPLRASATMYIEE